MSRIRNELVLLLSAAGFLTRMPVPGWIGWAEDRIIRASRYFALVGALIGACGGDDIVGAGSQHQHPGRPVDIGRRGELIEPALCGVDCGTGLRELLSAKVGVSACNSGGVTRLGHLQQCLVHRFLLPLDPRTDLC